MAGGGASSVIYRTDKVTPQEESFALLIDPALKGKVAIVDAFDETYRLAAVLAGVADPLALKEEDYPKVEAMRRQLRDNARRLAALSRSPAAGAVLPVHHRPAAGDLGASGLQTFARVVLPLSLPGIVAAAVCAFIPILVDYVTPALVGGPSGAMIGNIIYAQFTRANNWPLGSALSLVTMAVTLLVAGLILFVARRREPGTA